ncbi:hypothetical protein [Paenibacillus sp. YYML68]|uniref:hypothetical protein n=1 Tax=Paenibacillus sp. YYML68 TaxID=2909250 RepID=UPI00248FCDED|nr:hypothetical protein [Paenibacillus sp. YYML68]
MDLFQALQVCIGLTVEIYQATQMLTGVLLVSEPGYCTIQVNSNAYTPGATVTIFTDQIEFIRVVPA